MNLLTRILLEVKIGDRFYKLECSPDSPLEDISQSLKSMNNYIDQRIELSKSAEKNSEESPKKE
jgi:hypothetical protein